MHLKVNEPLRDHTTFHVGGPARYFVEATTPEELLHVMSIAGRHGVPPFVLGAGSNVIFSDRGFDGIVIRLTGTFASYRIDGTTVIAGAGVRLPLLARKCAEHGLSGFEGLAGIPGTVGGALIGNAGTSDGCIGDVVTSVEILSDAGTAATLDRTALQFSYRRSNLAGTIVLSTMLNLKKGVENDILTIMKDRLDRRTRTQPLAEWSAGSVFKNPPGGSAGSLIEQAGLKGLSFGGAKVSEKHANFIVNTGNAKAADITTLISIVHQKVKQNSGVSLDLEVRIIGE